MTSGTSPSPSFRTAQIVATVIFLALALYILRDFLRALAWAAVIAVALWPPYQSLVGRKAGEAWRKMWAPLIFTTLIVAVFLLPAVMAGFEIRKDATGLVAAVTEAKAQGFPAPDWLGHLPVIGGSAATWWNAQLGTSDAVANLGHRLEGMHLADTGRSIGVAIASRGLTLLFTVLILFFLLRDGRELSALVDRSVAKLLGPGGPSLTIQVAAAVRGAVLGLVLVGLGEGFVIGLGFEILAVPHPILFAAAAALLSAIPGGAMAITVLASLFLFAAGHTVGGIVLIALAGIVTFLADHFIRPVLIGGAAKLPFILVLLSLLGGLESFGLIGLFLGPAALSAGVMLWRAWLEGPPAGATGA